MLSTSPRVFTFDDQGRAWFGWLGEDGGLAVFDGNSWETYKSDSGLPDNWVTALEADSQGRVWIGINEKGVQRVVEKPASNPQNSIGYVSNLAILGVYTRSHNSFH